MIFKDMTKFWKDEDIIKAKVDSLVGVNISDESKTFLLQIGLPREFNLMLDFSLTFELLSGGYQIGFDGTNPICIDGKNDSLVQICSIENNVVGTFMNSNVVCLGKCLLTYKEILSQFDGFDYSEDESNKIVILLKEQITQIDIKALSTESGETWWTQIIEQIEYGII
jgi:hypothetical protein